MKKLLLLFIAISLLGCEKIINVYDITIVDEMAYYKHDMTFVTGKVRQYYEKDMLKYEGIFKDGKPEGVHKSWYVYDQISEVITYIDGKRDGLYRAWCADGQLW